jgi:cellulose synthase/poly-beta-1,6-N-acetylglucosamine synthase-like glycosyltransferase
VFSVAWVAMIYCTISIQTVFLVILILNCSYKKDFLIELLRLFYDIPLAEVMCNGRMDLRKLFEDVVWLQQWKQFTKPMHIHHYSLFTFMHMFPPLNVNWFRISENFRRPECSVVELMSKDFIPMPIANSLHIRCRIIN